MNLSLLARQNLIFQDLVWFLVSHSNHPNLPWNGVIRSHRPIVSQSHYSLSSCTAWTTGRLHTTKKYNGTGAGP